jgi:zinc/manganese transport system substrate-binding protein
LTCVAAVVVAGLALAGCSTTKKASDDAPHGLQIVAAENIWGDIAQAVGGTHVHVRSIINSPDADPHDYEPTPDDGRYIAEAKLVIVNGVGYDSWATKLIKANSVPSERILNVGEKVGAPIGGNPHLWYSPASVSTAIDSIVADLSEIDASRAADYRANAEDYRKGELAQYSAVIASIKKKYPNTPIGASESVVSPMAEALGLDMKTPASFLSAISEGAEPTLADKNKIDSQLKRKEVKVFIYNSQNATPDIRAQLTLAKANRIPVVTFTETMSPAGTSFVEWQVTQLNALSKALASAMRK